MENILKSSKIKARSKSENLHVRISSKLSKKLHFQKAYNPIYSVNEHFLKVKLGRSSGNSR